MAWLKVASLEDLLKRPLVVKHPPLQIALFHLDGRVFAVEIRFMDVGERVKALAKAR